MNEQDDFFSEYFAYCEDTESPPVYHRWCCITGIAAILGRRFFLQHGHRRIYPNFYTLLIGGPGTRKGSAISIIKDLLIHSEYHTFASTKTSKEKFLQDLGAGFSYSTSSLQTISDTEWNELLEEDIKETREVFICLDEFQDFIGASNVEFISLLTNLWDNLPFYDHRIKTGKSVYVHEPTINILSGSTPTAFATAFPPEIIGQGMLSRLLLIYSESTGVKITWPAMPSELQRDELAQKLHRMRTELKGECQISSSAKELLDKIYKSWVDIDDSRLKNYSNRRFNHLLKLCLICCASEFQKQIHDRTVILANSVLSFAESRMSSALGEFGKSKHADVAGKILQLLEDAKVPLKLQHLWKMLHNDLADIAELMKIMSNLNQAEKIKSMGKEGFSLKKQKREVNELYVDFKLLKEAL